MILLVAVLAGVLWSGRAFADGSGTTNQSAKLYAKPGEAEKVLVTLKTGDKLVVIGRDGRWLHVRVDGRTGWLPRTKVDLADDDDGGDDSVQRNTRRRPFVDGRSTNRGTTDGAPSDRVGADATDSGDDDGDDDDKKPAKPAPTKPTKPAKPAKDDKPDKPATTKKPAKPAKASDDDDAAASDDDDDSAKKPAKPSKPAKPTKPAPVAKHDDKPAKSDDDDGAKSGDDGDAAPAHADKRPVAHVAASAKLYKSATRKSDVAFKASPSDTLYVEDHKGAWTEVSMDDGTTGWIQTASLQIDEGLSAGATTAPMGARQIDARVRLGMTVLDEALRTANSPTTGVPDNYDIGTAAATLAIGGQYLIRHGDRLVLGGELAYAYDKAEPGVAYMGEDIKFSLHDVNLRAMAGYDLHRDSGAIVFGRLGYHYQAFLVSDVSDFTTNAAKLPSEVFKAPEIGAAVWFPHVTKKIGVRFNVDTMLVGASISQTKNLEDGGSPKAKGVIAGAGITYRLRPNLDLAATYDLNYSHYNFGMPLATSQRMHTGTDVTETDLFHAIEVGISQSF